VLMSTQWIKCLEDPEIFDALASIVSVLSDKEKRGTSLEFEAGEVGVRPYIINKLLYDCRLVKLVYHSNKYKFYSLTIPLEEARRILSLMSPEAEQAVGPAEAKGVDEVMKYLDVVIGLEKQKQILLDALMSKDPVHILFVGSPGTAKSLLLTAVSKMPNSYLFTAGTATKVGIRDIILNFKPRYLIIDELDKISNPNDLSVLLSVMWDKRISVNIKGKHILEEVNTSVIAAANKTYGLPQELLDRFLLIYIPNYSPEEKRKVIRGTLVKIEEVEEDLASHASEACVKSGLEIRECIQIVRMCRSKEEPKSCVSDYSSYIAESKALVRRYG